MSNGVLRKKYRGTKLKKIATRTSILVDGTGSSQLLKTNNKDSVRIPLVTKSERSTTKKLLTENGREFALYE